MRILTGIFGVSRGGSERAAARLAQAWRAAGHDAPMVRAGDGRFAPVGLAAALARSVQTMRPDIVFAPGQTYALPMALLRIRLGAACPPIVAKISNAPLHADRPLFNRIAATWLRAQLLWTSHFVTPDEDLRRQLLAVGIPRSRVFTIANPAADARTLVALGQGRTAAAADDAPLRLLSVGRLVRQKNFPLLIDAFRRAARPGDRLTIVGDGPCRARLASLARRSGHDIRLTGWLDDPGREYAEANGFVLASDFEGLPAVLVEALAAGLPIVATDSTPGLAELLGRHGEIVPRRDAASLAAAISRLRGRRPNREAMLARAMKFTGETAAPAYIDRFRELTASERQAA